MTIVFLIGAILCVCYGIFVSRVGSGSLFFITWFAIAAVFVTLALFKRFDIWSRIPSAIHILFRIGVSVGLIILAVLNILVVGHFYDKGEENLDYIIVLGAQIKQNGPSISLRQRLLTAEDYLRDNPSTICIVSGGQGSNEPHSEALEMKNFLVARGIAEDRIIMEDKSENTEENLRFSSVFFNKETDRIGIVSNDFHIYRALKLAKKYGYNNYCGIAASSSKPYLLNNTFRECIGVLKEWFVGNI